MLLRPFDDCTAQNFLELCLKPRPTKESRIEGSLTFRSRTVTSDPLLAINTILQAGALNKFGNLAYSGQPLRGSAWEGRPDLCHRSAVADSGTDEAGAPLRDSVVLQARHSNHLPNFFMPQQSKTNRGGSHNDTTR